MLGVEPGEQVRGGRDGIPDEEPLAARDLVREAVPEEGVLARDPDEGGTVGNAFSLIRIATPHQ